MAARYAVGIDLGTTHTAVAYADLSTGGPARLLPIEQLVAPGEVAARILLPSCRYHPAVGEVSEHDQILPWGQTPLPEGAPSGIVGELARHLGEQAPGRLVVSAKSWLSQPSVDRTAAILPWAASEDCPRISPVAAAASYLAHVRAAWNHRHPQTPLEEQDIVLTVPASFDEGARALTVEAAKAAGLPRLRLLEEPQAACYSWLAEHAASLADALADSRLLLVCDVGGGTTDLTLIRVEPGASGPELTRIGVGEHLMLGGDNMDLALARLAEARLSDAGRLGPGQLAQLVQQCRHAKEQLLAPDGPQEVTVTVLGAGARLVGGARSARLHRQEIQSTVVDGFLPLTAAEDRPTRRRSALVEFGLNYDPEPAISRHLAAFLAHHSEAGWQALQVAGPADRLACPDTVLLNGGVFHAAPLRQQLQRLLTQWRGAPPRLLDNPQPDWAVALGATYYTLARAGHGRTIGGGAARSYFLVVEGEQAQRQGVCLLPKGTEEGQEVRVASRSFALRLGQPVRFHLVSSTGDRRYQAGEVTPLDDDTFTPLPPIATVVAGEGGQEVSVELHAMLCEVGTLALACVAQDNPERRWQLEFQLRGEEAAPVVPAELHPRFDEAAARIERIFGTRARDVSAKEIKGLGNDLERILGPRADWDSALLRELFSVLWRGGKRRRRSAEHERVWCNLMGFCIRPGFGYPLDEWRVEQLWRLYDQGIQYVKETAVWAQWWTLWRRAAGGLSREAQARLLDDIAFYIQPPGGTLKRPSGTRKQGTDDMIRLAGSLERIDAGHKQTVGDGLVARLAKPKESPQTWWAVGRLGARIPFHGSAHDVVPPDAVSPWIEAALAHDWRQVQQAAFAATLMSRMSGDRVRDVEPALRRQVLERLQQAKAPAAWVAMVEDQVALAAEEKQRIFGEALPPGLKLLA